MSEEKKTIVVSAFPACGKSYMYENFNGNPYTMLDSDSSKFSWIYEDGLKTDKRNPNFIEDYITHIKENIGKVDVIFVSSHTEVRKALRDNNIRYFIVHPSLSMKDEMIRRMKERGNDEKFIEFQEKNFEKFIFDVANDVNKSPLLTTLGAMSCIPYILVENKPYITNEVIESLFILSELK